MQSESMFDSQAITDTVTSIVSIWVAGSHSAPPTDFGAAIRYSPALAMACARRCGSRRSRSASSAHSRTRSVSARARETGSDTFSVWLTAAV